MKIPKSISTMLVIDAIIIGMYYSNILDSDTKVVVAKVAGVATLFAITH